MLLLLKETLSIEDADLQIHADLCIRIRLFPRAIKSEVPPSKV